MSRIRMPPSGCSDTHSDDGKSLPTLSGEEPPTSGNSMGDSRERPAPKTPSWAKFTYRSFHIYPSDYVPMKGMEWTYVHDDYDPTPWEPDGPPSDDRHGTAATPQKCVQAIDDYYDELAWPDYPDRKEDDLRDKLTEGERNAAFAAFAKKDGGKP